MNKPKIDYKKIESDITDKCNSLLKAIDENSISDTFDTIKEMAEIFVQSYSYQISDFWKEENKNSDIHRKIKFTDIESGYLKLIRIWVSKTPLNTKLPTFPQDRLDSFEKYSSQMNKKAIAIGVSGTAIVGTAYARGWWVLANPIAAITAELILLAVLYKTVQVKKNTKRKDIECEISRIRKEQDNYKQQLIDCLISAVSKWTETVEKYSDSILNTF
ncbi:MAG: hypothetical protein ACRCZY_11620 [Phocaeicola sp.]